MSDVDEIKSRIDIVDLVSQYVTLRRAGRGFTALCPFHTEKTPSFHVDPARQSWHCFGACGTGGDIFSFVMRKEGLEFREAMAMLAERAGVAVNTRRDAPQDAQRARLFEVNEAAASFYAAQLQGETAGAAAARAYLEERRLAPASIQKFQLGYAPNAWDGLLRHLEGRGIAAADALTAGIAIEGERGPYDRFRHRLMFPIRDDRGRIAGFGGRLLPGEAVGAGSGQQPKYVNTSQTAVFDKGAILYGLDAARDAIREDRRAIIVEGYMDVIAAHEHGIMNVIASMGTALTERQVTLLKRYTHNLVLALDADAAGSEGMLRGFEAIDEAIEHTQVPVPNWRGVIRMQTTLDADVRVMVMPEGRDPDDVIRADPALFAALVEQAVPFIDFRFDAIVARHDLSEPRGRSAVVAALAPMIAAIPDRVVQAHYVQRLSRIAQVDEATLRMELRQPVKQKSQGVASETPAQRVPVVRDKREEFCLAMLFRYPAAAAEGLAIDAGLFGHSENRALFEAWVGWADSGEPFEGSLTPGLRSHYERIASLPLPTFDDDAAARALRDAVWGIEQQRLRLAKRVSAAAVADAAGDDGERIAEQARSAWQGTPTGDEPADGELDPAAIVIDDMEAGLKVHQRIQQRRDAGHPAGEVVNER